MIRPQRSGSLKQSRGQVPQGAHHNASANLTARDVVLLDLKHHHSTSLIPGFYVRSKEPSTRGCYGCLQDGLYDIIEHVNPRKRESTR